MRFYLKPLTICFALGFFTNGVNIMEHSFSLYQNRFEVVWFVPCHSCVVFCLNYFSWKMYYILSLYVFIIIKGFPNYFKIRVNHGFFFYHVHLQDYTWRGKTITWISLILIYIQSMSLMQWYAYSGMSMEKHYATMFSSQMFT